MGCFSYKATQVYKRSASLLSEELDLSYGEVICTNCKLCNRANILESDTKKHFNYIVVQHHTFLQTDSLLLIFAFSNSEQHFCMHAQTKPRPIMLNFLPISDAFEQCSNFCLLCSILCP